MGVEGISPRDVKEEIANSPHSLLRNCVPEREARFLIRANSPQIDGDYFETTRNRHSYVGSFTRNMDGNFLSGRDIMTQQNDFQAALDALRILDKGMDVYGLPEKEVRKQHVQTIKRALAQQKPGAELQEALLTINHICARKLCLLGRDAGAYEDICLISGRAIAIARAEHRNGLK